MRGTYLWEVLALSAVGGVSIVAERRFRHSSRFTRCKALTMMVEATLEDRVRTALAGSPHLARKSLKLQADRGRITLQGVVDSYYQKQMAQETLRKIDGVEVVENLLEVHWD